MSRRPNRKAGAPTRVQVHLYAFSRMAASFIPPCEMTGTVLTHLSNGGALRGNDLNVTGVLIFYSESVTKDLTEKE
jgi:hypothetical protein